MTRPIFNRLTPRRRNIPPPGLPRWKQVFALLNVTPLKTVMMEK